MANIDLNLRLGKEAVIEGREDTIPFILSVKGTKSTSPPLAFFIVIDTSYSMDGEKIFRAKEAALKVLDLLKEDDLVSIYGFNGKIKRVVTEIRAYERELLEKAIVGLTLGSGTNIYAILDHMARDAKTVMGKGKVAGIRVIFITDGEPTTGPKKPRKILEAARRLRQAGASALVIGVGLDYNEKLLLDIADTLNGIFVHVSKPKRLYETLMNYTRAAKEISGHDVIIVIRSSPGVKVIVYGRHPRISPEGIEIPIGDIHYRETIDVVGDFIVPPSASGEIFLGEIIAKYINPETKGQDYVSPISIKTRMVPIHMAPAVRVSETVYAEARVLKAAERLRESLDRHRTSEIARELEEIIEATMQLGSESLYSRTLNIRDRIEKEGVTPEATKELASLISRLISGRVKEEGEKE